MYCVKCGVKLQNGVEKCPLCETPVWNPEGQEMVLSFPDRYPEQKNSNKKLAFILTSMTVIVETVLLLVAFNVSGGWNWGGIAMTGVALCFVIFVLPLWIERMPAYLALVIDHMAIGGYLLYICCTCGGHWFMSFAFPVTGIHCLLTTAMAVLLKFTNKGRFFLFGGAFILWGGFTMLVEFFEHISFGFTMFAWSIYSASVLFAIGLFMILTGIIKPLKEYIEKLFFF